jgi:hypothetical protein
MLAYYTTCGFSNGGYWDYDDLCEQFGPPCSDYWPDSYCCGIFPTHSCSDGDQIGVAINWRGLPPYAVELAYTVFEFTTDF